MDQPTQTKHPWRATVRTVIAATVGLLPAVPAILAQLGLAGAGWALGVVAVIGGVTRVLAIPTVDDWLRDFVPWLAAQPPAPPS